MQSEASQEQQTLNKRWMNEDRELCSGEKVTVFLCYTFKQNKNLAMQISQIDTYI